MKYFVEYDLESKVPQKVKDMIKELNDLHGVSANIGHYTDEYFSIWMHLSVTDPSTKEEICKALDIMRSIGKESYRYTKVSFQGVYAELWW